MVDIASPPLGVKKTGVLRRAFLGLHLQKPDASILEIGALDYPMFLKQEGGVFYADHFSTAASKAALANSKTRNAEDVVDVDYIIANKTLKEATNRTFDLVVASHVIEHVPDIITWLRDIASVVEVGGYLFLAVPDRRFTFDYFRYPDDSVEMVRAFEEKRTKPDKYNIARHLYFHTPLRAPEAWVRRYPRRLVPRISFGDAIKQGKRLSATYTDIHCWVFTDESFVQAMWDLARGGYISWTVAAIEPPQMNQNEFRVLMRKK